MAAALPPWTRPASWPDEDPLEVTPHERFERETQQPRGIRSYRSLLYDKPTPYQPPYPVQLCNELNQLPMKQAHKHLLEIIYRISWAYKVPAGQVEKDLGQALLVHLQQAFESARKEGRLALTE